jgi:NADH-quinone oxidoreductase subunit J
MLAGSLLAVGSRNILHAVFGLAVALVGVAGIFFLLDSPFVAIMEILIYIGGIAVTMIFAVMLSAVAHPKERESGARRMGAGLVAGLFFVSIALVLQRTEFVAIAPPVEPDWSLAQVGRELLTRFNLAFETLSLVLLLAIVGAIVIVRKPDSSEGAAS